ncbi:mannose-6-phosphate isomerase, class I [Flavilitoribacter nigricans]|uniref:mannose-6-phosphate isomerase n=1 Tax=Flavilitoribacter nigricans (strain ATCC 23147 / DSM 23189 / NBRC 102662 / NCIMB 1420 / SS-2) TaxID=1122177 RepID=A0A2D0N3G4_FLAN2|nr:mannose-6-phosphate isomerase, class I [Flavilitoribacter nigricans]PHN02303.1 mannose-6-phosphate isomerase, class I [Flavilitoribacter nigricans DSM 23189 = NBRC 102662]
MNYPNLIPLEGVIQDYDWGGYHYIPALIGKEQAANQPQAELWMGAHDRGPAKAWIDGKEVLLSDWIATDPRGILGDRTAQRFANSLPFLFKILDVRKMLSIQAHPTKEAAEAGFERENREGIPLTARHRNYKDDNHKPEIMVALTDFWLLHGFQSKANIEKVLTEMPEFGALRQVLSQEEIKGLYRYIMELPQEKVDQLLQPLAERLEPELAAGKLERSQPDYWAAQAFRDYTRDGHYDRGVFSIYLYNLVNLRTGEGIFQDANVPHAYLEGVNVELMANSDNVFRGGLTSKHVDVDELMLHLQFEPVVPQVLTGTERLQHEHLFPAPVPDFELSRIQLQADDEFLLENQDGPAIYILLSGAVSSEIGTLGRGAIFFSPDGATVALRGLEEAVVFRAGTPE